MRNLNDTPQPVHTTETNGACNRFNPAAKQTSSSLFVAHSNTQQHTTRTCSKDIIFFIHLIFGMFARHNEFGMIRQIKRKQTCSKQPVQRFMVWQQSSGQYPHHAQQLDQSVYDKDETAPEEKNNKKKTKRHNRTSQQWRGRGRAVVCVPTTTTTTTTLPQKPPSNKPQRTRTIRPPIDSNRIWDSFV